MQANIKQEKNHAEFSELLDREEITAEARGERTDSDPSQHIPHHRWQLQAASKKPTYESRQECHSNIDQNRKFMLHLFPPRSEEHTSELQSLAYLVCRLLLEKKKIQVFNEQYDVMKMHNERGAAS